MNSVELSFHFILFKSSVFYNSLGVTILKAFLIEVNAKPNTTSDKSRDLQGTKKCAIDRLRYTWDILHVFLATAKIELIANTNEELTIDGHISYIYSYSIFRPNGTHLKKKES